MSVEEFYAIPRDPPSESKLPIFDEAHVRNAMARFNQIKGVSAEEKAKARRKIIARAKHFGIDTTGFEEATANQSAEGGSVENVVGVVTHVLEKLGLIKVKNGGDSKMNENKKGKIDALIANSNGRWTECDRPFLEGLSEELLDKLTPIVIEKEKVVEVNVLSEEDKALLENYKKELKARRDEMIREIQANTSKEQWPDEILSAMNDELLKRLHGSVVKEKVVDYSPLGGGAIQTNVSDFEPLYPVGVENK